MATTDRIGGLASETTLAIKAPCLAATTGANITLAGIQIIDGVSVGLASERVLVKDQTDHKQNNIYIASTGNWQIAPDADGNTEWANGTLVYVVGGAINSGQFFEQTCADSPVLIGTSLLSFVGKFSKFDNYLEITGDQIRPFLDLYTSPPVNGVFMSPSGATIGNAPLIGALPGLSQVSALYVKSTARQSAALAEYMVTFDNNLNSGLSPPWHALTAYTSGQYAVNAANLYVVTTGGTSAASGGPTGTGAAIVDGTVRWAYVNSDFVTAKVGFFNSSITGANASYESWGMANDLEVKAGDTGIFKVGAEFDITNDAYDFAVGVANAYNIYVSGNIGAFPVTAQVAISPSPNGSHYSAHYGLLINGVHTADTADIEISGGAPCGLSVSGLLAGSSHSIAAIQDQSASPVGLNLQGTYSNSSINMSVGTRKIAQGGRPVLQLVGDGAAVNFIQSANAVTGSDPVLSGVGLDTNVNLVLTAQGTGAVVSGTVLKFGSASSFTALGSQAVSAIGSNGVSGHGTILGWLTFINNSGATIYVPYY